MNQTVVSENTRETVCAIISPTTLKSTPHLQYQMATLRNCNRRLIIKSYKFSQTWKPCSRHALTSSKLHGGKLKECESGNADAVSGSLGTVSDASRSVGHVGLVSARQTCLCTAVICKLHHHTFGPECHVEVIDRSLLLMSAALSCPPDWRGRKLSEAKIYHDPQSTSSGDDDGFLVTLLEIR